MSKFEFKEPRLNSIHDLQVEVLYLRKHILNMEHAVARLERSSNLLYAIGIVLYIMLIVILCNVLVRLQSL